MNFEQFRDWTVSLVFVGLLAALGLSGLLLPDQAISESERRPLTQYASFSEKKQEAAAKGKKYGIEDHFAFLEKYTLDQFPARDAFRSIKAVFKLDILRQRDNNGYYSVDGDLSRLDAERNDAALADGVGRINGIYEKYFRRLGARAYYCLIPDKNAFLAEPNGYPHYDYDAFFSEAAEAMNGEIQEISIRELLSAESYYRTDPHWDQAKLLPAADALLAAMGSGSASARVWEEHTLSPFYGTYYGQLALPVAPDSLTYLTYDGSENISVYDYASQNAMDMYALAAFDGVDPYDVFLGGARPLLRIDNPACENGKQLVVFRDSFGSSMIPLLAPAYSQLIVADIRYITPDSLFTLVRFEKNCDVLFLYSTSVLNTYGTFLN